MPYTDPLIRKRYLAEYKKRNREKIRELNKKSYYKCRKPLLPKPTEEEKRAKIKGQNDRYRARHKEKIKLRKQKYYQKNKETINKKAVLKRQTDIQFKLAHYLRVRLSRSVKSGSAIRDLGCSISELKSHLEAQFQEGMTWENYGITGWHIDHIKPLCNFNLENREEFLKACHYSNLQPLWATENLSKNKYNVSKNDSCKPT